MVCVPSPITIGCTTTWIISTACKRDSWLVQWLSTKVLVMFGGNGPLGSEAKVFPDNITWLNYGDGTERTGASTAQAPLSLSSSTQQHQREAMPRWSRRCSLSIFSCGFVRRKKARPALGLLQMLSGCIGDIFHYRLFHGASLEAHPSLKHQPAHRGLRD